MPTALRLKTFGALRLDRPGADADTGPRPRTLALLAILAASGPNGMTRDRVMAILWPEADEERARHTLSQTLYNVRRDLGRDVVLTGPTLRLDPERLTTDVADFRAAVAAKEWETAAALYTGPFLDGFVLADAAEFERWAESERAALATLGARAIENVAKSSAEAGRLDEAAEHWHRLTRLDPADPRLAAAYMQALDALGERAAALAHGRAHAELIRREYEAEPHSAIERLMARLRELHVTGSHAVPATVAPPRAEAPVYAPPPIVEPTESPPAAPVEAARGTRRRVGPAIAIAALVAVAALGWRWIAAARPTGTPVLAVGRIRDLAAPDSAALGGVLSEMLATSLGRVAELQVVANSRMLELTPGGADTSRAASTDAARRAGATDLVEGELIPLPGRQLRLEVRRVDVARGLVRGGYRISGGDRIALFDSVTALIAADLRAPRPNGSLADVSTRSPVAYRLYEEGVRALYQSTNPGDANHLLHEAVREDSTFVMAAYYAWRVARLTGQPDEPQLADHALALASRASPRDRLLIVTHVGADRSDPRALAAAETLATNYPRDPEALVRAAQIVPDLPRAVVLLDRAIAIDSTAGSSAEKGGPCRLCDAFSMLTTRYEWADSVDAVQRTLRRWRSMRPNDTQPWVLLFDWLVSLGRRAEAEEALRQYDALGGHFANVHFTNLVTSLRLDDLEAGDRACADALATTDGAARGQFRWYCVIALRMEGRYRDALALARDGRVPWPGASRKPMTPDPHEVASVELEGGAPLAAADEFYRLYAASDSARMQPGVRARQGTWLLTLTATAAVAGGDTARARGLVDTIDSLGRRSLFGRDQRLHHFVRGLLHARAHEDEAAVREYRAAMHSPTYGYTRINLELGRALLALRRPDEGIPVVQAALHGGIEGSNLYVTRTELHELLARLFDAAGRRDSAAAHYRVVERAWRSADPFLRSRYEAARGWLARAAK